MKLLTVLGLHLAGLLFIVIAAGACYLDRIVYGLWAIPALVCFGLAAALGASSK